jgi:hypothetical protein
MDHSDDEDVVDGQTNERDKRNKMGFCSVKRLGELEVIMKKLKKLGHLDPKEEFGKSDKFHCLSSNLVKKARLKMKTSEPLLESERLFLNTYERFHECLLKKLHDIMRNLEADIRKCIRNVLESFLELLGRNRIGILKALRDMGDFIANAQKAENHLHDNKRFHRIFDKILTSDGVIVDALITAKERLLEFAEEPVTVWNLEKMQRDPKRKIWLSRFGLPEDRPISRTEEQEQTGISAKLKAVCFVIEAERVIVNCVTETVVRRIDEALAANGGEFKEIINKARSESVGVLSGLFDQAYRVRQGTDGFDGVTKMHDIVNWTPIKVTVRETMYRYCEEVIQLTKIKPTNVAQWRTEFIGMAFGQFSDGEIALRLREGCFQRLNEMHREFMKITSRVSKIFLQYIHVFCVLMQTIGHVGHGTRSFWAEAPQVVGLHCTALSIAHAKHYGEERQHYPINVCLKEITKRFRAYRHKFHVSYMHSSHSSRLKSIFFQVKDLREAVKGKGSENIKLLESDVKPRLLLHMCEVASIEFQRNGGCGEFETGRQLGRDGDFTFRECPWNRDWVIYVARKCDSPGDDEWLKVTEHVFFAE